MERISLITSYRCIGLSVPTVCAFYPDAQTVETHSDQRVYPHASHQVVEVISKKCEVWKIYQAAYDIFLHIIGLNKWKWQGHALSIGYSMLGVGYGI